MLLLYLGLSYQKNPSFYSTSQVIVGKMLSNVEADQIFYGKLDDTGAVVYSDAEQTKTFQMALVPRQLSADPQARYSIVQYEEESLLRFKSVIKKIVIEGHNYALLVN